MINLPKVIGIIYPLPKETLNRMFGQGKNIFIKFTTHEPTKKTKIRIKKGIKLYFYQSNSGKIICGDAEISNFEYLDLNEVIREYKPKMIITQEELIDYAKGRERKKLLVLKLRNIKKYKQPIKLKKSITMTGLYITRKNKNLVFPKKG